MWGASPLGNRGSIRTKGGVIELMDDDPEEGSSLLTRVRLEFRLDIDDEGGSDGGKKTSLLPLLTRAPWNFIQNSRRSGLYSNPHHASS